MWYEPGTAEQSLLSSNLNDSFTANSTFIQVGFFTSDGSVSAIDNGMPSGGVSVFGDAPSANATAKLIYYLQVVGPQNTTVPVSFIGAVTTAPVDPNSSSTAESYVDICYSGPDSLCDARILSYEASTSTLSSNYGGNGIPNVYYDETMRIETNTLLLVSLYATSWETSGSSSDPYIYLDTTANPGYSIVLSPGVGDSPEASPVPEPSALLLVSTGVGLLGVIRRKLAL